MVVIDSVRFYRPFWICMRILAPTFFGEPTRLLRVYVVALQFLITLCFPMHLLLHILQHSSPADLFKNLIMTITCSACSLKHVAHFVHLPEIREIDSLITQLDKFIESENELEYYRENVKSNSIRFTRCLYFSFGIIYAIFMLGFLVLVASGTGELIIPAYFPFDWKKNQYLYALAVGYQLLGVLVDGIQGLTNDTYTPLTLCLLGGHIHLWAMRMSRLGIDGIESDKTQYRRFLAYIEQHKLLMRLVERTPSNEVIPILADSTT